MNRLTKSAAVRTVFAAAIAMGGVMPVVSQAQNNHGCRDCGTVVSSHTYQRAAERASGVGAGGGAILGGLLGNQVGSGNGRTLATVAGAVGGAYAGNRVERNMHTVTYTDTRVRMNRGGYRVVTEQGGAHYRNGDNVRVEGNHIRR